jgi:hypothetical protein
MELKPVVNDRHRRLTGLVQGVVLGFLYGIVSQAINYVALPGVPYYQPPFGPVLNTGLSVLIGALLGLVVTWSDSSGTSIVWGSVVGAAIFQAATYLTGGAFEMAGAKFLVVVLLFLPITAMIAPFMFFFRWVVNRLEEYRHDREPVWKQAIFPIILIFLAMGAGYLSLYPADGRQMVSRTQAMIKDGLAGSLAASLQPPDVLNFASKASASYTLQLDKADITRYAIPQTSGPEREKGVVVARFDTGWTLACLFDRVDAKPECRGYSLGNPIPEVK